MNNIKLIAVLIFVVSCSSESSQSKFESLLDSEWSKIVNDNPVYASSMGDLSRNAEWSDTSVAVSYTHLRAHETKANLVCRLLLEKKKNKKNKNRQKN